MARFTENNTEGFSSTDLSALNAAYDAMLSEGFDDDMNRLSDRLNNVWFEGATAEELTAACKEQMTA